MTETTKRIIIAAVAAAVLIGGSVAAIALTDDSDDERDRSLVALAEELDDEFEAGEVVEELLERFFDDEGSGGLPERILDLLDTLRHDLAPRDRDFAAPPEFGDDDRSRDHRPRHDREPEEPERFRPFRGDRDGRFPAPGEHFGGFGLPFLEDSPLDEFLEDGHLTPEERAELEAWLRERFGEIFGFELPEEPFAFPPEGFAPPELPGLPFGDLPLDEFLEDGHISPDEARELERLFRESIPGGVFRFEFVPPETDRPRIPDLPDALLEGLRDIPFRELLADGELSPEEQEIIRNALNAWLDRVFERLGSL